MVTGHDLQPHFLSEVVLFHSSLGIPTAPATLASLQFGKNTEVFSATGPLHVPFHLNHPLSRPYPRWLSHPPAPSYMSPAICLKHPQQIQII